MSKKCGKIEFFRLLWGRVVVNPQTRQSPSRIDYTNVEHTAFWLDCIFVLLGSSSIKASGKHVDEIDPKSPG